MQKGPYSPSLSHGLTKGRKENKKKKKKKKEKENPPTLAQVDEIGNPLR